jgi:hypothetical protein
MERGGIAMGDIFVDTQLMTSTLRRVRIDPAKETVRCL